MKVKMYSIKDTLVGFSQPFPALNDAVALRMFIGSVQAEQPNICNTYPENKQLWSLCEFDDQTGEMVSCPTHLAEAAQYVVKKAEEPVQLEVNENGTNSSND